EFRASDFQSYYINQAALIKPAGYSHYCGVKEKEMGPLSGVKIIEVGGIGPGPFCGMMLSDMGADIIRVERKGGLSLSDPKYDLLTRNRKSISINLRNPQGAETLLKMIEQVDALQEGFRPGVMEKLGIGPDNCLKRNPRLVYGRMTGWGQEGPLARAAGHDINYIALSGALHSIGRKDQCPVPPLNLVGDFGGGGMLLAFGMVCALLETHKSGQGQVVDAAMTDGSATLMTMIYGLKAAGLWTDKPGTNLLDTGAHFYDTYETADKKFIAIGAIEPQFYELLLKLAEIDDPDFQNQLDFAQWPQLKEKLTILFKTKTRDAWCKIMEGSDVCFAPVLSMSEAPEHPHNKQRNTFIENNGVLQPAPSPRFSRTAPEIKNPPPTPGQDTESVLADFGFSVGEIDSLKSSEVI
ncbi:MAG: CaiB/BaiF CoA-transferase family protein, partial [Desulfobacterales bacterium]|nr:CaiB/BaiF CoA-transferase family protein [Desulfobacterales bacterium]MDX2511565.1 CaiB/BaiF CoA-transferase family protein [Desulfobacterales bacterium]